MLTIFSVPKSFSGHIGIIQRNAIKSWSLLHPDCEIILCGDEPGIEEAANEFKAKYLPKIARNEYGTPLLDYVFNKVQQIANHNLICYVNADIILLSDFLEAIKRIRLRRFLAVGQRWDMDITQLLDFGQPDWVEQLRSHIAKDLPAFAVGRPGWDNWVIYNARKLHIPVVDVSRVVTVIHQSHGYSHVYKSKQGTCEGPEGDQNLDLLGDWNHVFTLLDATHVMTSKVLLPALGYKYLRRRWQTLPILNHSTRQFVRFLNRIANSFGLLAHLVRSSKKQED
jgi:hypothetical protein